MSLILLQNATAAAPGISVPTVGSGGTAPYLYSISNSGAGGTVDQNTGVYTAPLVPKGGVDTIQVQDALFTMAQGFMLVGSPLILLCDIIRQGMQLSSGQVYLWDQKGFQGLDANLYVAVSEISVKPFGSSRTYDDEGNQVQSLNVAAVVDIDIYSRGPAARDRKEEILLALNSNYSQAQQEANSFYIAPLSKGFQNISMVEGPAIPYRFNISVAIQYAVTKSGSAPYYNTFPTVEITTNA